MEDVFMRQIDKMARALASILLSQVGLKNLGNIEEVVQYADEALKSKLNINIADIIEIPNDDLVSVLLEQHHLNNEHIGILADILFNSAKAKQSTNGPQAKQLFTRCLTLYKHLASESNSYAFDWRSKIAQINKIV
jgi:hypothetical protein